MVERHSDPLWERQAKLLCSPGRSQECVPCCCCWSPSGGSQLQSLKALDLPLIAQEAYVREREREERLKPCTAFLNSQRPWHHPHQPRWVAPW